jgi:hypothetical protein
MKTGHDSPGSSEPPSISAPAWLHARACKQALNVIAPAMSAQVSPAFVFKFWLSFEQ